MMESLSGSDDKICAGSVPSLHSQKSMEIFLFSRTKQRYQVSYLLKGVIAIIDMKEAVFMNEYGYVRVSAKDQNEDRQLIAMQEFPIRKDHVFTDKISGKNFDRPAYNRLIRILKPGDVLVVKSIDRLGRNYEEILEQWRVITKKIGADMVVLDMPLLDTRQVQGRDLTGTFIADLVLQILSYVAQTERDNIRQRQAEGIQAAKRRGVKFGPPEKPVPKLFFSLKESWQQGKISSRTAARMLNIHHSTFLRWIREKHEENVG